jgi:guanylate kinase
MIPPPPTAATPVRGGPLIVVSGPSGVGKSTLVESLLRTTTLPARRAITATTRLPRPDESPGIDYHYWTSDDFRAAIDGHRLLEYALVHGTDFYGTPLAEVEPHRAAGIAVLLVIDVQGADAVRRLLPGWHVSVFVMPPGEAALETRLRGRGTETEERVQRRLVTARAELARAGEFDHCIVNDDLEAATLALEAVVRAELERCLTPPTDPATETKTCSTN